MQSFRAYPVYAAVGIVSGLLTPHLSEAFRVILPDWVIIDVPVSMWLAGLAFGVALAAAFAYCLQYQSRQLLIIPIVLAGWFCAVQVCLWSGAEEPKPYVALSGAGDPTNPCTRLDGTGRTDAERASEKQCFQLVPVSTDGQAPQPKRYWRSMGAYGLAGAIGALITAFGIPIATRRSLAPSSYVAITLTGAVVAAAWFVLAGAVAALSADQHWYALFAPWQAAVAAVVGRSLRT